MIKPEKMEEFNRRLGEILSSSPARDWEKNIRALASAWLSRLNVATREEFDAQERQLARAFAKLQELEEKIKALEKNAVARKSKKAAASKTSKAAAKKN
jgi:BMFP domain-containing protein YqiC